MATRDEMNSALRAFKDQHTHAHMRDVLMKVAGVNVVSEVPDNKIDAVLLALKDTAKGTAPQTLEEIQASAWNKWNKGWVRPDRSQT